MMNVSEIEQKINGIICESLQIETVELERLKNLNFVRDLGMDSLIFVSLVLQIEDLFSIEIPNELLLMEHFDCIDKIVILVERIMNYDGEN